MTNSGNMGMNMKDLTPIICLLAPLLLAAIMIPAKMTMMMNGMMGGGGGGIGGMIPMVMLPNGMLPGIGGMLPGIGGMLPGGGGMLPGIGGLTGLLMSGSSGTQLPVFKKFGGKEFSDGNRNQSNETLGDDNVPDEEHSCDGKECKKGDLSNFFSGKEWLKKRKMQTSGDATKGDTNEWSSRIWSEKTYKTTLANQILSLLNEIEKTIQHYEL
ncbi:hypothetical protein NPIL_516551 [Nephila pilipes]|uniref:Uncharacterized protein n=1 Tax=Nephila pilipes TaxID=299642 RepID=A0A8X6MZF0_NEPPI|nr:hypothetical protein NPIL_516551 [Nephila pilipes]